MIEVYKNFTYESKRILNDWFGKYYKTFLELKEDFGAVEDDILDLVLPPLIYTENKQFFNEISEKLYHYICDDYVHELSPAYQYLLYGIIEYFCDLKDDGMLDTTEEKKKINLGDGYKLSDFYNFSLLFEAFFWEYNFLEVALMFEVYKKDINNKKSTRYFDFDCYAEIMPNDIKKEWEKLKNETLIREQDARPVGIQDEEKIEEYIKEFISRFRHAITEKGAYKLLWNDDGSPKKEEAVQILFENLVIKDCKAANIDVSREVNTGRGVVDFKFSNGQKHKLLLEVKLASNRSKLNHGIEKQIIQYLKSEQINTAVYLVIIHYENDFGRVREIQGNLRNMNNDDNNVNIIIELVDATRNKKTASHL